jgi:hypothetical protein
VRGVGRAVPRRGRQPGVRLRRVHAAPRPGAGRLRLRPVRRARARCSGRRRPGLLLSAPRVPLARPGRRRAGPGDPRARARWSSRTARRLRAGRGGPARRSRVHHPLAAHRRALRGVPGGEGQARGAVRRGRARGHRRRLGGRHRRSPPPAPHGVRAEGGRRRRPPDGPPAAPRRRPGPVHPAADARVRRRDAVAAAHLDPGEPRLRPVRRGARRAVVDVAAHVRAPLRRRDRGHPARLDHRAARTTGRAPARGQRPAGGAESPTWSVSPPPRRCATSSPRCAGSAPRSTAAGSAEPVLRFAEPVPPVVEPVPPVVEPVPPVVGPVPPVVEPVETLVAWTA